MGSAAAPSSLLRSDSAGQLVVRAHDNAHDLARPQRGARGRAHASTANRGKTRPGRSVIDIGVKRIGVCADTVYSANQLVRGLLGHPGICIDRAADGTVAGPVGQSPSSSIETGAEDARVVGFGEAHHIPARVHRYAIGFAGSDSAEVEEAFPSASRETIYQGSVLSSKYSENHSAVVIGGAAGGAEGRGCEVRERAPGGAIVKRPRQTAGGVPRYAEHLTHGQLRATGSRIQCRLYFYRLAPYSAPSFRDLQVALGVGCSSEPLY